MTCKHFIFLLSIGFTATAQALTADAEIDHLLKFVEGTQCRYERNGEMHSGKEAAEHIQKKYAHFKDEIATAEDFIALSATKSELSGKKYRVYCGDKKAQDSDRWLLEELKRYRQ
ncbi:DUF5329 family protein [Methylomicrobium lacus]|uniref:DUF5329 family protein n=1 Tax=Methylomicrobium lacus TaxID=136992 RepID=UPI0035A883C2